MNSSVLQEHFSHNFTLCTYLTLARLLVLVSGLFPPRSDTTASGNLVLCLTQPRGATPSSPTPAPTGYQFGRTFSYDDSMAIPSTSPSSISVPPTTTKHQHHLGVNTAMMAPPATPLKGGGHSGGHTPYAPQTVFAMSGGSMAMHSDGAHPGTTSPVPPSRFASDFIVDHEIGSGTFGTVYCARGRVDGVQYAVKRSKRRFHGSTDRTRMMHEVHALAEMSASEDGLTIVRYFSAWVEDDHLFLVMELCEGSVEGMLLNSYRFDTREVFKILRDILLALRVLHRNEFVHLDVKTANILVKSGHFKLGDFGLALHTNKGKVEAGNEGAVEEGDSRYLAREMLDWGPVADLTKCDIFSLGISAYEIAFRTPLAPNGEQWHMLRSGDFPLPADTPQELSDVLRSLMHPDPRLRPTAAQALETFLALKSDIEKELYFQKLSVDALKVRLDEVQAPKPGRLKRYNTIT